MSRSGDVEVEAPCPGLCRVEERRLQLDGTVALLLGRRDEVVGVPAHPCGEARGVEAARTLRGKLRVIEGDKGSAEAAGEWGGSLGGARRDGRGVTFGSGFLSASTSSASSTEKRLKVVSASAIEAEEAEYIRASARITRNGLGSKARSGARTIGRRPARARVVVGHECCAHGKR